MNNDITEDPTFLKLQLTQKWIDVGIITIEIFEVIREEYIRGEDQNSEHYRWKAFKEFIKANTCIKQEIFFAIDELGKSDPDYSMGRAMRFDLLKRSDCPVELLDITIHDSDKTLAKHALKCRDFRKK
jgi:hypothetical protein